MEKRGRFVIKIRGDGLCFLKSILTCLNSDFNFNYTYHEIANKIFTQVDYHSKTYLTYLPGKTRKDLLEGILGYLKDNEYTSDYVDIAVKACADVLNININIINCVGNKFVIVPVKANPPSDRMVMLKFDRDGSNADHYHAVIIKSTSCKNNNPLSKKCDENNTHPKVIPKCLHIKIPLVPLVANTTTPTWINI